MRPLLTPAQMVAADAAVIAEGTAQSALMERAGQAVVSAVVRNFTIRPVLVLAGPGNNGGDGRIAARRLAEAGWPVRVLGLAEIEAAAFTPETLVIDALFGTGLARPLSDTVRSVLQMARAAGGSVLAVDIPSGVDGATGEADLGTLHADRTITFAAKKLGHVLHPGAAFCGTVEVADIGIPTPACAAHENGPWTLPIPAPGGHKYDRGHAVIFGGARMTGAARLAAAAAARAGAGLVTVVAPPCAALVYRCTLPPHILCEPLGANPTTHINDTRRNVFLIGPGAGDIAQNTLALLEKQRPSVLDADALTYFENEPERILNALHRDCVLTPHEGEAARLFGPLPGSKIDRAQRSADMAGCTVLLKGPDTVIAAPGRTPVVNTTGTPYLATAGAGDVLAGIITGLIAQGMPPFAAACAGAFLHGRAAETLGPGLVAPDLIDALASVMLS